jgi:hypothetical protein
MFNRQTAGGVKNEEALDEIASDTREAQRELVL